MCACVTDIKDCTWELVQKYSAPLHNAYDQTTVTSIRPAWNAVHLVS